MKIAAFSAGMGAALAALLFLDQPVARIALEHAPLLGPWPRAISAVTGPVPIFSVLLVLTLMNAGKRASASDPPAQASAINLPLRLMAGGAAALAVALLVKGVIGRARPAPGQLDSLRFDVLNFTDAFASMPSAQASLAAALAAMIIRYCPLYRWYAVAVAATACLARAMVPEHWLSDVIAGVVLGAAIGHIMPLTRTLRSERSA